MKMNGKAKYGVAAILSLAIMFPGMGTFASAQDSLSVSRRSLLWNDPVLRTGTLSADGHSMVSLLQNPLPSMADVSVQFRMGSDEAPRLPQEGNGLMEGTFNATSLRRLGKSTAVSGGASYRRGIKRGVRWNSSSDFTLLYPYVMADSIGGDMQSEAYSFYGKYAHRTSGRFLYGVGASYRALHEYRTVDPRPRNITSDFMIGMTGGMLVGEGYVADLSASYRRYHQQQDVDYVNNLGAKAPQLHLTGLGSHYARFEGNGAYLNTRYRGGGFKAGAGIRPKGTDGLSAGALYEYFEATKHLIGQNEAPYVKLCTHTLSAYAALRKTTTTWRYALQGKGSLELRNGHERVIDNVATGIYDDIYDLLMYHSRALDLSLEGVISRGGLSIMPTLGYSSRDMVHRFPERTLSYSHLLLGTSIQYTADALKWQPLLRAKAIHCSTLGSSCSIPEEYTYPNLLLFYKELSGNLSDSFTLLSLEGSIQRALGSDSALRLTLSMGYIPYGNGGRALGGQAGVGFLF